MQPAPRGGDLTSDISTCTFAGVDVLVVDRVRAVDLVVEHARARRAVAVHLCNAYTLTLAAQDSAYAAKLAYRSVNLPDGVPVGWFYRLQSGRPNPGPVRGPELMRSVLARGGVSHFFLGGDDQPALDALHAAARQIRPDVDIAGSILPPFAPVTPTAVDEWALAIKSSGADVVWVGLGTPKQDEVLALLVDRVDAVVVGVGAAFAFLAGTRKEAPERLRGTGLEWVHRLASEPRRLWRRYLIGNAQFLAYAARGIWSARRGA
jgi:N-acetylglucosaminyldiphosphoundecaprenol N-acetyl-beta-D-mannosaminyltransferase